MKDKKLFTLRIFALFCVFMGVPISFVMNYFGAFSYIGTGDFVPSSGGWSAVENQLIYFTVWSNILAFIWVTMACFATATNNKLLNKIVEYPGFKNTPFIMMFITMSVSFIILYPFFCLTLTNDNGFWLALWITIQAAFLTPLLFQHGLVSIVLIADMKMTKGYSTLNGKKENGREWFLGLLIGSLIPLAWVFLSVSFIATEQLVPQYPFMNLFPDVLGMDGTLHHNSMVTIISSWITFLIIALVWFVYWILITKYTNKRKYILK